MGVSGLNCHSHTLHLAKPSIQNLLPSGVVSKHQPTCLPSSICMELDRESTTTEAASVAQEEAHGIGDYRKKRQRRKHAQESQLSARAQFAGHRLPVKFGCQPIKLKLHQLAHTYPANCVRVHSSHLGVYKESRVAYRAIRVRVS